MSVAYDESGNNGCNYSNLCAMNTSLIILHVYDVLYLLRSYASWLVFSIRILLLTWSLLYKHSMRRPLRCTCECVCPQEEGGEEDKTLPLKHQSQSEASFPSLPFPLSYIYTRDLCSLSPAAVTDRKSFCSLTVHFIRWSIFTWILFGLILQYLTIIFLNKVCS